MELVDPQEELRWIEGRVADFEHQLWTGLNATGWPAATWVLHAMHREIPVEPPELHDRSHVDWVEAPTEMNRVRWVDHAKALGIDLFPAKYPPCFRSFPDPPAQTDLLGPHEGSMDEIQFHELVQCLAREAPNGADTQCFAMYAILAGGSIETEEPELFSLALGEVHDSIRRTRDGRTPSNLWSADREWFIYTDWDLWATKVSGSEALINAVRSNDLLEHIDNPIT